MLSKRIRNVLSGHFLWGSISFISCILQMQTLVPYFSFSSLTNGWLILYNIMNFYLRGLYKMQVGVIATPDIHSFDLTQREHFIILGCDGLWGVFLRLINSFKLLILSGSFWILLSLFVFRFLDLVMLLISFRNYWRLEHKIVFRWFWSIVEFSWSIVNFSFLS